MMRSNSVFKKFSFFIFCFGMIIHCSYAQDALLQKQLHQSQYLRFTMKPDSADMGLTRWEKKKATMLRELPLTTDFKSLQLKGPGVISIDKTTTVSGQGSVIITTPSSLAKKNPTNRSY